MIENFVIQTFYPCRNLFVVSATRFEHCLPSMTLFHNLSHILIPREFQLKVMLFVSHFHVPSTTFLKKLAWLLVTILLQ